MRFDRRHLDHLYHVVELDNHALGLMNCAEFCKQFSRLRRLSQLGMAQVVFPLALEQA